MLVSKASVRTELVGLFTRPIDRPLTDDDFTEVARRVFAYQFRRNEPYAAYCKRRGVRPEDVQHWTQIPAVPTAAFKELPLVSGKPGEAEAVFRTSGTTRGKERRGEHYILDLSLYHGSLLPNFAAYLLPDGAELPIYRWSRPFGRWSFHARAHDRRGHGPAGRGGRRSYATVASGSLRCLDAALERYASEGTPVMLLGTSFSFVLDRPPAQAGGGSPPPNRGSWTPAVQGRAGVPERSCAVPGSSASRRTTS